MGTATANVVVDALLREVVKGYRSRHLEGKIFIIQIYSQAQTHTSRQIEAIYFVGNADYWFTRTGSQFNQFYTGIFGVGVFLFSKLRPRRMQIRPNPSTDPLTTVFWHSHLLSQPAQLSPSHLVKARANTKPLTTESQSRHPSN